MERTKVIAASVGIAVVICAIWLLSLNKSRSIERALNEQKLKTERTLAEKLQAEKVIEKNNSKIAALVADKQAFQTTIEEKALQLSRRIDDYERIQKQYSTIKGQLALKVDSIRKLNEHNTLTAAKLVTLGTESTKLQDSLTYVNEQNRFLQAELAKSILQSIDQTLVTPLKKNEKKITARARSTRRLVATVTVPGELENMTFTIEGPDSEAVSDVAISSRVLESSVQNVTASLGNNSFQIPETKIIEIVCVPSGRLKSGVYKIKILNNGAYVGSMRAKLK